MSGHQSSQDRLVAAFYPYGFEREPGSTVADIIDLRLDLGVAEIVDAARGRGTETYTLERTPQHWQLRSRVFDGPPRLLARVRHDRLPEDAAGAGAALLMALWSLRYTARLCYVRSVQPGALGEARWKRIARAAAPLEQRLREEGHDVQNLDGPIRTREHLVLLKQRA